MSTSTEKARKPFGCPKCGGTTTDEWYEASRRNHYDSQGEIYDSSSGYGDGATLSEECMTCGETFNELIWSSGKKPEKRLKK